MGLLERAPLDIRINALKPGAAGLPEGGVDIGIAGAVRYPHGARIEDIVVCGDDGPLPMNLRPHDLQVIE